MKESNLLNKIVKVGENAAKSFFGAGASNFTSTTHLATGSYRGAGVGNSGWLFDAGGKGCDVHFNYAGLDDVVRAYECCAPVYSIINKQAYAFTNGNTWITDDKGAESDNKRAKKVRELLKKPNVLQNGKQFEAQLAIYLRLFGYCIILPIKPVGYDNMDDATSLWIIPPYMCEFEFAKQTFYNLQKGFITSITVRYGNESSILDPEQLIIIRDITPGFDNLFLPGSPIKPLQQNISNLIGIYNSKGTLINYRGALGILSPEIDPTGAIPMTDDEKKELQDGLLRYGIKAGQWKFIVSNTAMKWQQMGISYRELMLTEWAEDDTMVICDGLNYPFKLLANTKTSSMNGTEVESFKKILYQDFVIPFADMIYEQFTEAFDCESYGCKITKSYVHVAALQGDAVKLATARLILNQALSIEYEKGLITLNQWLDTLGRDTIGTAGDIRSTDTQNKNVPLASIIGVGGVQSLVGVLAAANISEEARSATIQILFGISPENASLMTQSSSTETAGSASPQT